MRFNLLDMKKSSLQSSARSAIKRELTNNTSMAEIKSFANDILAICAKYPDNIPITAIKELTEKHPSLSSEINDLLKKETTEAEESAMREMRKIITS